ncbi:MAG: sporulation integral membrane protein YtvI [Hungatella sp.]|jgi:sporulation integral membrane protein YtvI|nr:sporulation integral membrane protein YtvI [Hungatella sp.]
MEDRKRILRILLNILIPSAAIVLACTVGPWLLKFFMPFVIGWCIAMIANPLVRFLEKHLKLVRRHSSVLIVVLVLAGVIGTVYFLITRLFMEMAGLIKDLPEMYEAGREEVQSALLTLSSLFERLPDSVQDAFIRFNDNLGELAGGLVSKIAFPTVTVAGNVAKRIPAALVNSIVVIFSSYFFIVERDKILAFVRQMMPKGAQEYVIFLKKDLKRLIGGYFVAQFRIMFVVAVILAVGFLVLGVNYGLILAVLIAFLDFLPLFGTGTALFPWALVKLLSGEWAFAAGLILLYVLTQAVRQIIQPKIVGDSMGLSPFATLFFLYLGFKLRGISGMILAVPIGILAVNLYQFGTFDSLIANVRLLADEINRFRKEQ